MKIQDDWAAFKAYKKSATAVARSDINKANAAKKKYHHRLGTGGYRSAIPKWLAAEARLLAKGIPPQTLHWPERSKFWMFAHGAYLDEQTGLIVAVGRWKKKVEEILPKLVVAIDEARRGVYKPDREDDELSRALGNPEHVGRLRGQPGGVTVKIGFPECADSYRSRARKKKKGEERLAELEQKVQQLMELNQQKLSQQQPSEQQLEDPQANADRSQLKSSVGSTQLEVDAHYAVDDVTERTDCELHMPFVNISMKVAIGYVLPNGPEADEIPAGYARVYVDEILPGMDTLSLEIPGVDGETKLGEVYRGFALWNKKYIVLSRPSTPPCGSPPHQQSPVLEERDYMSTSPSRSPPREEQPVKFLPRKRKVGSPIRRRPRKQKTPPPPEKLPWDKTVEENAAAVKAHNAAFFAPKVPEPKFTAGIAPEACNRTVDNLYNPPPSPPSDYERYISKSYDDLMEVPPPKKGKEVPQLGQQEVQSVPPLKVFDAKEIHRIAAEAQRTPQQIGSSTDYAIAEVVRKYVPGENLVDGRLSTKMRELHTWYKKAVKEGNVSLLLGVKEGHYCQLSYAVSVEFTELFQLYNIRALDKSIISSFCL